MESPTISGFTRRHFECVEDLKNPFGARLEATNVVPSHNMLKKRDHLEFIESNHRRPAAFSRENGKPDPVIAEQCEDSNNPLVRCSHILVARTVVRAHFIHDPGDHRSTEHLLYSTLLRRPEETDDLLRSE